MKILSAQQIKAADIYTIEQESLASIDLMERAAIKFTNRFTALYKVYKKRVAVLVGIGNNGGDGLAIARLLLQSKADLIIFIVGEQGKGSPDFLTNLERAQMRKMEIHYVQSIADIEDLTNCDFIIDAMLGIGLNRRSEGVQKEVVDYTNQLEKIIVSVDIPSGLFADLSNQSEDSIIRANDTITFQQRKYSFLFPETGQYCGKVHVVDIGISRDFYKQTEVSHYLLRQESFKDLAVLSRSRFAHKGNFGHLVLVAGTYGKAGAGILSAKAALRTGVGLLTALVPGINLPLMQMAVPEAMCLADDHEHWISNIETDFATAYAIGPGLGESEDSKYALLGFLISNEKPTVLDADALNILAKEKNRKTFLGNHIVITPHPKEFERWVGSCKDSFERLEKAKVCAAEYNIVVVLKGAHTAVVHPSGDVYFNTSGNPGMATAGSGDVLTGMIGALLAQGLSPFEAAKLAVYVHGLAGDMAAEEKTELAMIAGDIIGCIPKAVKELGR